MNAEGKKKTRTPEETERLRKFLNSLPRDDNGLSPLLVELADVLPAELFELEDMRWPTQIFAGAAPRGRPCGDTYHVGPRPTRLPPLRGKLSAVRLTDEGAHGDDGRFFPPPLIRLFGPPSPLWGEGKACRGRGPGRPLLAPRANSPSCAPRRRPVSARRGGPVCPPPRSRRTYRCAPTGRREAGAEAKASPRERQRAAEGGGPCG